MQSWFEHESLIQIIQFKTIVVVFLVVCVDEWFLNISAYIHNSLNRIYQTNMFELLVIYEMRMFVFVVCLA